MCLRAIYHARERSCLVVLRDGCCDNDNATFDSITFCYIGIVCDIQDRLAIAIRSLKDRSVIIVSLTQVLVSCVVGVWLVQLPSSSIMY